MSNIEVSVTGSDSPLQESCGRPRGHPFTDFHASYSTNSEAPNSAVFWKDPSVLLTFTASQHYQHKHYCAPCLCFFISLLSLQENTRLPGLSLLLESNVLSTLPFLSSHSSWTLKTFYPVFRNHQNLLNYLSLLWKVPCTLPLKKTWLSNPTCTNDDFFFSHTLGTTEP